MPTPYSNGIYLLFYSYRAGNFYQGLRIGLKGVIDSLNQHVLDLQLGQDRGTIPDEQTLADLLSGKDLGDVDVEDLTLNFSDGSFVVISPLSKYGYEQLKKHFGIESEAKDDRNRKSSRAVSAGA